MTDVLIRPGTLPSVHEEKKNPTEILTPERWEKRGVRSNTRQPYFLRIYKFPRKGHDYSIGVDVAEGKIQETNIKTSSHIAYRLPDSSVACVVDFETKEQVAVLSCMENPSVFAELATALHWIYNKALMVVEANGPGIAVIQKMEDLGVRRFFQRMVFDKVNRTQVRKKGWKTTNTTRDELIRNFVDAIRDENGIIIQDRATLRECLYFKYNNRTGKAEHPPGKKDDLVFAIMLAWEGRKWHWRPEVKKEKKYRGHPDAYVWKDLERRCRRRALEIEFENDEEIGYD